MTNSIIKDPAVELSPAGTLCDIMVKKSGKATKNSCNQNLMCYFNYERKIFYPRAFSQL